MVIRELLEEASYNLGSIENHVFEAHLILRTVLKLSPIDLVLSYKKEVDDNEIRRVREMVLRRLGGEPLQYILGTQEFMGLEFFVDKNVLIPRADTETLVEAILSHLGKNGASVLDIGCGSGCVGLSAAHFNQRIYLRGVDISEGALAVAQKNAKDLGLFDRAAFNRVDILTEQVMGKYDVVVSNPPYIRTADVGALMREVRDFEPRSALDGGEDGLIFYRRIVEIAPRLLNENGFLAFEVGYDQAREVAALMRHDFINIEIIKDLCGVERVVTGVKAPLCKSEFDKERLRFDFGSGAEHDGYIKIRPDTLYDSMRGCGIGRETTACTRPRGDYWQGDVPVLRDWLEFSDNSFTVKLENGTYMVRIYSGDYLGAGDSVTEYTINGVRGSFSSKDGCVLHNLHEVDVTDGKMLFEFKTGAKVCLNAIEISPKRKLDAPSIHADVTAEKNRRAITLNWSGIDGAADYTVRRQNLKNNEWDIRSVVSDTSFTDTEVELCGEYIYRVAPRFGCDFEADRAQIRVTVVDGGEVGSGVAGFTLKEAENSVALSWNNIPEAAFYNIYRRGPHGKLIFLASTEASSYTDFDANTSVKLTYAIEAVTVSGKTETSFNTSKIVRPPLKRKAAEIITANIPAAFSGAVAGDLDGDGEYELIVKRTQDNGVCCLDAYKQNGKKLWSIDLGVNIRAAEHCPPLLIYDFNNDGKAEIITKTADGTTDGVGKVIGDRFADYRNKNGFILEGPEFLTLFDGETGAAVDTVSYSPPRGNIREWGDSRGICADRFLSCTAYLDGENPSAVLCRGGGDDGCPLVIAAYDVVDNKLVKRWKFLANSKQNTEYTHGCKTLYAKDIDCDGKDEIICGALAVNHDGRGIGKI